MKKLSFVLSFAFCLFLSVGMNAQSCSKKCAKKCSKKASLAKADAADANATQVASMSKIKDVENMENTALVKLDGESIEECAKRCGISVEECKKRMASGECAKKCTKGAKTCSKGKTALASNEGKVIDKKLLKAEQPVQAQPLVKVQKQVAVKKAAMR